jgi:PAS domain S-box-containing protein
MPDPVRMPVSDWRDAGACEHFAYLYEHDDALVDTVTGYIGAALASNGSALAIATRAHRDAFERRWVSDGLDIVGMCAVGRYAALDADELLARILVDGLPDRDRFVEAVEPILVRTAASGTHLAVFDELVALLWRTMRQEEAIRLEAYWNELAARHSFALCCAYRANEGGGTSHFPEVSTAHTLTLPAEAYTPLSSERDRLAYIADLQQRAHALDGELAQRKAAEALLDRKANELPDFLDKAGYAIHSVGADGRILWANRYELSMLGYSLDEYVGRHIDDIYVRDAFASTMLERLSRGETLHEAPATMRCKDGTFRNVTVTSNVHWEDGFVYSRCFTRDVTEQMRFERALEEARADAHRTDALLASIVASSDDAIVSKTLEGRITSWNDGARRLFGYERDEVIGKPILIIVPDEYQDEEREILRRLARGERIDHFETVRMRKDGVRVDVSLTISPIRDRSGRIVGASKVARDISERKRIEEQLRVADRRKDEFLAMLGHELRNPLAPIRTVSDVLQRTLVDNPRALELCAILQRQVEQMTRLLDDLLDVTRITRGTIRFEKRRVELSAVIQRAVEAAGPLITRRKQRLRVGIPRVPMCVVGDFARLVQLVTNLLNNAAKYTPTGGRIALRVVRRGAEVDIRIQDNGAGIAREMLPRVFDLFVQSETATGMHEGLGIGLTLVRAVAEHHGGRVIARSAGSGCGSRFDVTLPLAASDGETVLQPLRPATEAMTPRKRIVIVDDNRDAVEALATLLRLSGHDVSVAMNGQEGLRLVEKTAPDLALLDIAMPGMSGYEVARRLREAGCKVKLAAITGYGGADDRERSRAAGFDHHIVKPIDPAGLERLLG